jgi:hypothetical protein
VQIVLTLIVIAIAVWYSTREHRRQLRNLKGWQRRVTNLGPTVPSKAEIAAAKCDALYAEDYARRQAQKR